MLVSPFDFPVTIDHLPDLDRALAAASFTAWCEYVTVGRHTPMGYQLVLCDALEQVERGDIRQLIVAMPPGHGKSEYVSRLFAPWWLGRHPDDDIILASYGASLAEGMSEVGRDVFREFAPVVFGQRLSQHSLAVDDWRVAHHAGGLIARGVGGQVSGHRARLFLLDDPIKDPKEADSANFRAGQLDWFRSVMSTRMDAADARVVLVMTRWHEGDLAGHLLADPNEHWRVIRMPAIAEEDERWERSDGDVWTRRAGEALWPEKFPVEWLLQQHQRLGKRWWDALYRQTPQPSEGTIFKRAHFRYFREDHGEYVMTWLSDGQQMEKRVSIRDCQRVQTVDLALTTKESSDYTVVLTGAMTKQHELLVLNVERVKLEAPEATTLIQQEWTKWQPHRLGVESHAYQLSMTQLLRQRGLPVVALYTDRDKEAGGRTVADYYAQGTIYHKAAASWLDAFEDELLRFPHGEHDDQVDALKYATTILPGSTYVEAMQAQAEQQRKTSWAAQIANPGAQGMPGGAPIRRLPGVPMGAAVPTASVNGNGQNGTGNGQH